MIGETKSEQRAQEPVQSRQADHPIDALFLSRWSPRAFTDATISEAELSSFFEAARWAPSSYNNQPWRFVYGRRGTRAGDALCGLLNEHNQSWARKAAAWVLVASKKTFDNGKECRTHSFDAGAAWMSLALQAWLKGWAAHAMEGFDYDKALCDFGFSKEYHIEAMIAVGRPGNKEDLPEALRAKEFPSPRKPVFKIAFKQRFVEPPGISR